MSTFTHVIFVRKTKITKKREIFTEIPLLKKFYRTTVIMNMKFSGKDADANKIEKKSLNLKEKYLLFGDKDSSLYSPGYISIGNDDIMIFVPKPYSDVDYLELIYDFLTNGKLTAHTIGGEFPDYETYKLALREKAKALKNWKGEDGCWLIEDRAENKERWWNGYDYYSVPHCLDHN